MNKFILEAVTFWQSKALKSGNFEWQIPKQLLESIKHCPVGFLLKEILYHLNL